MTTAPKINFFAPPPRPGDAADQALNERQRESLRKSAAEAAAAPPPPTLGTALAAGLERAQRRADGTERALPLPWKSLAPHFGGGLWPGLHMLVSGTGVGKTQIALQAGMHAAKTGFPVLYVGLELGALDLTLRTIGLEAHVPWSALYTGQAGRAHIARAREVVPSLEALPFHFEVSRPHGFAPSELASAIAAMRTLYPETNGPGSRPMLVVVDFVQLIGDEPGKAEDVRVRVGRAAYALKHATNVHGVAVLGISSVARERYKTLEDVRAQAGLEWDEDPDGRPIKRRILNTDAIVGLGKETGDIEYSADSVSIVAKVPATWDGQGCDVVFATPKGRATGATWSPLRFTGHAYVEPEDAGGRLVDAWKDSDSRRERVREEKRAAKDTARDAETRKDADAVRQYVAANPGCSVRQARRDAVRDSSTRWARALDLLGDELDRTKGLRVRLTDDATEAGT